MKEIGEKEKEFLKQRIANRISYKMKIDWMRR
jgi:hypothetical protein